RHGNGPFRSGRRSARPASSPPAVSSQADKGSLRTVLLTNPAFLDNFRSRLSSGIQDLVLTCMLLLLHVVLD
ncbi:hypothetical protein Q9966_016535, partial [Columba livia]